MHFDKDTKENDYSGYEPVTKMHQIVDVPCVNRKQIKK
jgi:hypothetical protein